MLSHNTADHCVGGIISLGVDNVESITLYGEVYINIDFKPKGEASDDIW